jgi:hypothetical protein
MTVPFVQKNTGTTVVAGVINVAYSGAQTAGNLNVVCVWLLPASPQVTSVTDVQGNTYHLAFHLPDGGTTDGDIWVYYAYNIAAATAGVNVVHVAFSGTTSLDSVVVLEYTYTLGNVDALRIANGAINTGAAALPTVNLANTVATDIIFAFATSDNGQTAAASGFTLRNASSGCTASDANLAGGTVAAKSGTSDTPSNIIGCAFRTVLDKVSNGIFFGAGTTS